MKIGFLGLGRMGEAIAHNLLRAGYELTVFNRTAQKAQALAHDGARIAETPAAAAAGSEAVFTMLADDSAALEMTFGPHGLAQGLSAGAAHISLSTIGLSTARHLAAEHAKLGQGYLSAPVFGRPDAAAAKRLLVTVAGNSALIARLRPVLDSIGRQTFVAGSEPWQANAVKLCGNFMLASMLETFGESFAAIRKADVAPHLFLDIMNELFASPVYKNYGAAIANENFQPAGFALKLGLKDVKLALEVGNDLEVPMPFASVLRDSFLSALANGQAELDWSSVALVAARQAGLKTAANT